MEEPEFAGVELLRLAPYSAPLNPIEEIWSAAKAVMKREMATTFANMVNTEPGVTQHEHRLRYLEEKIDRAMENVTPLMCMRACNHVQRHWPNCMALDDLLMGE